MSSYRWIIINIDFLIPSTKTLIVTTEVRTRVTRVRMDWLVSKSQFKFMITGTDLTPRWGRLLSGLWALDSARSPLRSRSATSRSALRSRSIVFCDLSSLLSSRSPDFPLRFPLRAHTLCISPTWGTAPVEPIATKFGNSLYLTDIIVRSQFDID